MLLLLNIVVFAFTAGNCFSCLAKQFGNELVHHVCYRYSVITRIKTTLNHTRAHNSTYIGNLGGRMVIVAGWELRANRCHRFEPKQRLETKLVRSERI